MQMVKVRGCFRLKTWQPNITRGAWEDSGLFQRAFGEKIGKSRYELYLKNTSISRLNSLGVTMTLHICSMMPLFLENTYRRTKGWNVAMTAIYHRWFKGQSSIKSRERTRIHCGWECKMIVTLEKDTWEFLKKLNITLQ